MNKIESALAGWVVGAATAIAAFNYADYRGKEIKDSVPIGQYTEYFDIKNNGTFPIGRVIYNDGIKKHVLYAGEMGLGDMTQEQIENIPPTYSTIFRTLPLDSKIEGGIN